MVAWFYMNKILISTVLFSSLVFGGCNFLQKTATETMTQLAAPEIIEEMLKDIEDPLVRRHLAAQFQVRSYRTITDSSGRGQTSTTEVQIEGESSKFHTSVTDQGKPVSDMIVIGETTYIKDLKDGAWWMQTAPPAGDETSQAIAEHAPATEEFQREFEEKGTSITYISLGQETCGSLNCYKYREEAGENEGTRTFWFDDQQFLMRRDEYTYGEFTTVNTYEYGDINISAPSSTKPVPEGKNIYEYMMRPYGNDALMPPDVDLSEFGY